MFGSISAAAGCLERCRWTSLRFLSSLLRSEREAAKRASAGGEQNSGADASSPSSLQGRRHFIAHRHPVRFPPVPCGSGIGHTWAALHRQFGNNVERGGAHRLGTRWLHKRRLQCACRQGRACSRSNCCVLRERFLVVLICVRSVPAAFESPLPPRSERS